jgi:capsular exopolysaccharide synthesis family protein
MSRIDEALRIAEGASGAVVEETTAFEPGHLSSLTQYTRETLDRHAAIESSSPSTGVPTESLRPISAPTSSAADGLKVPDDAELRARLVTGTSSTVSLEQYRRLAAVLHEAQIQNHTNTVMITSTLPHEGKTLTVVNLALTLTESYARRVLVIDADLRWPSLHTILGIANDRGLTDALHDGSDALPFTQISHRLTALTAGTPGATPLAGLSSPQMGEVLARCAARFDWVLIDTPPVGLLPDAQVLARLVGEVILVIRAGATPASAIERAVAELGGPDAISGTVLNHIEERRIAEAGYYGRYGMSRTRT